RGFRSPRAFAPRARSRSFPHHLRTQRDLAGFDNPPAAAATTQDVDAIIPNDQVQALADDLRFWDARDAVNEQFKSEGLYITHFFPENEVFLRRDWAKHIVPITRLQLNHLKLSRPATVDL